MSAHHTEPLARAGARRAHLVSLTAVLCGAAIVLAQYRVNTGVNTSVNRQIYGNTSSSVRYGRSYTPSYANHPTSIALPSESRNMIYRSGALPSTIRMNHASVGPMAPQGVAAYVPQPTNFQSSAVTRGNYVNPGAAPGAATGSMRYALPAPGRGAVGGFSVSPSLAPAQMSYSQMVVAPPQSWGLQSGSVRFAK